jgi:AraC-like DNA-binding protein
VDIVGDAIRALRIGEPRSARAYLYGHWGLRWDPSRGPGFNLTAVRSGHAWLRADGHDPVELREGDLFFVSRVIAHGVSDAPHTTLVDVPDDASDFWFENSPDPDAPPDEPPTVLIGGSYYLNRDRMHPLLESLPAVVVIPATSQDDRIRSILDLLGAEHDDEAPGSSAAIPALLDLLVAYVIRAAFETADHSTGWPALIRDRAMTTALLNMQNRPETPWTVGSLARASGMSRATFALRFHELVGQPPLRYLTWWRMNVAKQLLAETDLPMRVIAQRVGYGSEFAFGKAFSREVGVAPGAHRRDAGHQAARRWDKDPRAGDMERLAQRS